MGSKVRTADDVDVAAVGEGGDVYDGGTSSDEGTEEELRLRFSSQLSFTCASGFVPYGPDVTDQDRAASDGLSALAAFLISPGAVIFSFFAFLNASGTVANFFLISLVLSVVVLAAAIALARSHGNQQASRNRLLAVEPPKDEATNAGPLPDGRMLVAGPLEIVPHSATAGPFFTVARRSGCVALLRRRRHKRPRPWRYQHPTSSFPITQPCVDTAPP